MLPYSANREVQSDTPTNFHVDTRFVQTNGKPRCFGAVQINQGHVSDHLMPVHPTPDLLVNASKGLMGRLQDRSFSSSWKSTNDCSKSWQR